MAIVSELAEAPDPAVLFESLGSGQPRALDSWASVAEDAFYCKLLELNAHPKRLESIEWVCIIGRKFLLRGTVRTSRPRRWAAYKVRFVHL